VPLRNYSVLTHPQQNDVQDQKMSHYTHNETLSDGGKLLAAGGYCLVKPFYLYVTRIFLCHSFTSASLTGGGGSVSVQTVMQSLQHLSSMIVG